MQDESTLDNDGGVLAIIADLASLSATRHTAYTVKWSDPAIMHVVCPEASGSAPGHITGLLARGVIKRDML